MLRAIFKVPMGRSIVSSTEEELDLIVDFLGALTDESLTPAIPKTVPSGLAPIDEKYQASQQKNNNNNQNQTSD